MSSVTEYVGSVGTALVSGGTGPPGSNTWSSTTSIESNSTFASASPSNASGTQSLEGYNAFSSSGVPGGSTFNGFVVTIFAKATGSLNTLGGCNLTLNSDVGAPATNPTGTTLSTGATYTYGSSTDPWTTASTISGTTISSGDWTVSNINSASESTGPTFSFWGLSTSGTSKATQVQAMQFTAYYTVLSPPGAPTGLYVSQANISTVVLIFTQGSGTVTDNVLQESTDNTTWNTIVDNGSPVTTLNASGLAVGTPYYFRVGASNGAGAAYSSSVPFTFGALCPPLAGPRVINASGRVSAF